LLGYPTALAPKCRTNGSRWHTAGHDPPPPHAVVERVDKTVEKKNQARRWSVISGKTALRAGLGNEVPPQ
jgi:hypothetical protein